MKKILEEATRNQFRQTKKKTQLLHRLPSPQIEYQPCNERCSAWCDQIQKPSSGPVIEKRRMKQWLGKERKTEKRVCECVCARVCV